MQHFDREREYHGPDARVYTTHLVLEIGDIWEGIDRLERRGVSLDQIERRLSEDWETSVIVLARVGRRQP